MHENTPTCSSREREMKGLIVFNEATDISFYSIDSQFQNHLLRRLEVLGVAKAEEGENDLRGPLTLFFAPLTTSFNVLSSLKKPLVSITADNDFLIVFKKFGEQVFVAVNGDGSEQEDVLVRKLHAFNRVIGLLYGPVTRRMNLTNLQQRAMEWKTLTSLLSTYEALYNNEQAFLMEAVEHIGFGQLNAAQEVCVSLAEDCLNTSLNGGIHNMKHVLLLVGSKILAICGRSPQLPTADILLLILITMNLYQDQQINEETTELLDDDNKASPTNNQSNDPIVSGTPYQTPTMSPDLEHPAQSLPVSTEPPEQFKDDDPTPSAKSLGVRLKLAFMGGGKKAHHDEILDPAVFEEASFRAALGKFHERKVFLQLNQSHYIPHKIHCLEVFPQIVLVLVSEPPSSGLAAVICQTLNHLKTVLGINSSKHAINSKTMYDVLEDSIKRIFEGSKSEAKSLNSDALRQCVVRVFNTWAKCKEFHILQYIDKQIKDDREFTRITNQVENLIDHLTNLYEELYFSPKVADYDKRTVVSRLLKLSAKLKQDYGDYLAIKATINLPFPGIGMDYPGMVHFAFVDRSFDELTSPSILDDSVTSYVLEKAKENNQVPGTFLRTKMWKMVQKAQNYVSFGYSSQTWMDDDFLYTYCIWISTPNPNLGVPFRMLTPSSIKQHDEPPGVLCGNFYKDIKGGNDGATPGYVNELYCIHEARVSLEEAAKQCRSLGISLWMNTKQALAPFPLIN